MSTLSIALFGKLRVHCDNHPIVIHALRAQELFCYLLLHRDRPQTRELLVDVLWGDNTSCRSKKILRQALWHLQAATDTLRETLAVPIFIFEADWIEINPQLAIELDIALFEQAFTLSQGIAGGDLDPQTAQQLDAAVKLYQGDLLEGLYAEWCLYERERFQNIYLAMLDKLMDYCAVQNKYEAGIEYGRYSLRYDRARERTHRRLMRLQCLMGDRTGALRQYECCVTALAEELSVSPSQSTRILYQQIRADQINTLYQTANSSSKAMAAIPGRAAKALDQLAQLQNTLAHIEAQIAEDIRVIEQLVYS